MLARWCLLLLVLGSRGGLEAAAGQTKPAMPSAAPVKNTGIIAEIQALVDARKYQEAEEQSVQALRMVGSDAEVYNLLGFSRRKQKKWEEAITAYRKALEIKPEYAQAKEYLAVAYLNIQRVDEAKALHKELAVNSPELAVMVEMEARRLKVKW